MQTGYHTDFGPFDGKVWLNCAHQGPLPRVAADEAREAITWKVRLFELTAERFADVPARLRRALGRLLGTSADEIILGNSASYGLHLLAGSLPLRDGDEVLLVHGEFPSVLLPWLVLELRGVRVRYVHPARHLPEPEELSAALTPRTRVFCTTWVHSFSGVTCDIEALGAVCRANVTWLVVNASQALGARPFDASWPVDAVLGVGFKWLCGPYGTGFLWVRPDLLRSLNVTQAYWLAQMRPGQEPCPTEIGPGPALRPRGACRGCPSAADGPALAGSGLLAADQKPCPAHSLGPGLAPRGRTPRPGRARADDSGLGVRDLVPAGEQAGADTN